MGAIASPRPGAGKVNIESAISSCVKKKKKSESGPCENVTKASLNELPPVRTERKLSIKMIVHGNI